MTLDKEVFPSGNRSLSGIAARGFLLGTVFGPCSGATLGLLYHKCQLWRIPFCISTLCIFHFLEFWTTARYNTSLAFVSSYLLEPFANGSQYQKANILALAETITTSIFLNHRWTLMTKRPVLILGLVLIIIGQIIRSFAMIGAGSNFHHVVQSHKATNHTLVTSGVFKILRHPSYFGFFWWALGAQFVLGNTICLFGHAVVMWRFFKARIERMH
jgi:protein-S-isoprenylcysteine O-methyltransferase